MSAATAAMMAWLKAAAETGETREKTPVCLTTEHQQVVVLPSDKPLRTGSETRETCETAKKTRAEVKTTETAPPDLPSVVPTPAPTAPPAPAKPGAWFRIDAPWRVASKAWQAHRWQCPMCMAADRTASTSGTGQRCEVGQALYEAYEAAPLE